MIIRKQSKCVITLIVKNVSLGGKVDTQRKKKQLLRVLKGEYTELSEELTWLSQELNALT